MKSENMSVEEGFYQTCAQLLGIEYTYVPWPSPTRGPNRWNNRHPGNGRFPGIGTIRMYGPTCIHVALRDPMVNKVCKTMEEVYDLLRTRGSPDK